MKSESESLISLWWHTIDRWIFCSALILMGLGVWLILAASPSVALQHQWGTFLFVKKHSYFLVPGIFSLIFISFLKRNTLVTVSLWILCLVWLLLWVVWMAGPEIKGARRWINFLGFSLQPSEFLKPVFIVWTAHLLSKTEESFYSRLFQVSLWLGLAIVPLFLQPDLGTIFLVVATAFTQFFVAGLPWVLVGVSLMGGLLGLGAIYLCFPHAASRIHSFLSPTLDDPFGTQYQILHALKSFAEGGLWGKGPGSGTVLDKIPDSHADFIFAVAGEELGLVACLFILFLYAVIVYRGMRFSAKELDPFFGIAVLGLVSQLAFQVILNVGSVLRFLPTKGVTLPLISYGGSSFLSVCWSMGLLLALGRRYKSLL